MVERAGGDATEGSAVSLPGVDASAGDAVGAGASDGDVAGAAAVEGDGAGAAAAGDGPGAGAAASDGNEVSLAEPADAVRTDRLEARLAGHLDTEERVRIAWVVRQEDSNRADEAAGRTVYAVTDRRLLAVEPDRPVRSTPFARRPAAPALALGSGLVVAVLAFLGGAAAASGWTALLLVVTCVGGLTLAEHGRQLRRAAPESRERPATAVTAASVAGGDRAVVRGGGTGTDAADAEAVVGGVVSAVGDEETGSGGGESVTDVQADADDAVAAGDDD